MVITVIVNLANVVAMLDGLDCVASNCLAMPDVRNTVNARMVPAYVHKDGTVDIARYVSVFLKKILFTNSTASKHVSFVYFIRPTATHIEK